MLDNNATQLIQETADHVRYSIQKLLDCLANELAKAQDRQPVKVCELSRALSDEADHAFSHPEVWDDETYNKALELLQRSADVTVGTDYESNCARRPAEFMRRITIAREAKHALERIGC